MSDKYTDLIEGFLKENLMMISCPCVGMTEPLLEEMRDLSYRYVNSLLAEEIAETKTHYFINIEQAYQKGLKVLRERN